MSEGSVKKKKKEFKLPHLMFIMLGLIIIMSLLTFMIPAGNFATDPDTGQLIGDRFELLGDQTPVNPWQALMLILTGIQNSGFIIGLLLVAGGSIGVILGTGALDHMVDYAIFKLKDKGVNVLVPVIYLIFVFLGAFGGGDQVIALVPVGLMFAKKLRLDPIIAIAMTIFSTFVGYASSPTAVLIPQTLMGVPVYSGFGVRFVMLCIFAVISALYVWRYAARVAKNPANSALGHGDWVAELDEEDENTVEVKEVQLDKRYLFITVLFITHYLMMVAAVTIFKQPYGIMPAIQIVTCVACGLIAGWNFDRIGDAFAKGVAGMAFVSFIIGCATTMSLVMTQGNILHPIVYYASLPLKNLSTGFAAIGISTVITFINLFIPSASAKAAILMPIVRPLCESLAVSPQVGVLAFQFGDGFTNVISPALGVTVASLAMAKVPYDRYLRWALPIMVTLLLIGWVALYILGTAGWTGY